MKIFNFLNIRKRQAEKRAERHAAQGKYLVDTILKNIRRPDFLKLDKQPDEPPDHPEQERP